jgi:hypothetical protein
LQFEKFPFISLQEKSRLQNPITKGVTRPTRITIYLNKSVDRLLLDFGTLRRKKHNEEHPHTTMRYLKTCGKIRKQRKTVRKNKDTKKRLQLKTNCKENPGGAAVCRSTWIRPAPA